jgi:seryl-tRNA synthetase
VFFPNIQDNPLNDYPIKPKFASKSAFMLQILAIRENKKAVAEALAKRNLEALPLLENVIDLDEKRRATQTRLDSVLAESNTLSKQIGKLFKTDKPEEANKLKERTIVLKEEAKDLGAALSEAENALQDALYLIPNTPHKSVVKGTGSEDNQEVYREGDVPDLGKNALPHWELARKYDIIDFELGVKITGAGFPVYKDKGARLQRALINFFLDRNIAAGYMEIQVPHLVNEASGYGTGQLPDKEGQMYLLSDDPLYLIPTAEVPVTNLLRDTLLEQDEFIHRYTAYTPCFRREAGSYGAHVRGLNRLHQFDKVEIVRVEKPEHSYAALDEMVTHIKGLLKELKLPYRILRLCGGDMGFTAALTYDFEVYSTAQQRWLEISSVSNFESYQANRLKLRYRDENRKPRLAHTLNGSALALPRVVAGILENYQTDDGIRIPEVLVPYTGFDMIR